MGDYWNEEIVRTAVANQNLDIDDNMKLLSSKPFMLIIVIVTDTEGL